METKDIEVSDDYIFLQLLLEKHGIEAKQLAGWIGRATSTIYKYLSGELTIPSVIWRSIFDHTLDIAVFTVIRGNIPCIIAPLIKAMVGPDAATLGKLIDMRQKQLTCEQYILKILQDGKIDQSDTAAIANYKNAFPEMISVQAQLHQAILHEYSKSGTKI
jgi:hypothetical protein